MLKQQRTYSLLIETNEKTDNFLEVLPPFTVEFDISRPLLCTNSTMTIRIFNLAESRRKLIYKDPLDFSDFRSIVFRAGYNPTVSNASSSPQLATVFAGNVTACRSVREGENNVTTIEAQDGGVASVNAYTSQTFPADTSIEDMLLAIAKDMTSLGVKIGGIGSYPQKIQRANTVEGRTADLLATLSNNGFFIDNSKIYCLGDNETLPGAIATISSSMGLLGTPVADVDQYRFDMLFEPRLILGQGVALNSSTDSNFNGLYKVVSLHHRGTISEAVSGNAVTTVGLWKGLDNLNQARLAGAS